MGRPAGVGSRQSMQQRPLRRLGTALSGLGLMAYRPNITLQTCTRAFNPDIRIAAAVAQASNRCFAVRVGPPGSASAAPARPFSTVQQRMQVPVVSD